MTLAARRVIFYIFILVFVISAPLIIFYTLGYRYNFEKNKIQKTGIFVFNSKPEKSSVFLNGNIREEKTPARIINLLPVDYLVKIEKDGYYSWQKNLTIQAGLTTFAENIFLFEKNQPQKILDGKIYFFSISPDYKNAIYIEENKNQEQIWQISLSNYEKKILYQLPLKNGVINIEWSADGQKILIDQTSIKKYIVLDINDENANIYNNLSDFYPTFKKIENKLLHPETLDNLIFLESPLGFTTILNKKNKDITVFQSETGNIIWQEKAELAKWSPDKDKILYLKNLELWIYSFSENRSRLITRNSQEIKNIFWVNSDYILFLVNDTVKSIELDDRDARNVVDLIIQSKIENIDLDTREQKIYFTGELQGEKGLFELSY
jgi:hypothetical protein